MSAASARRLVSFSLIVLISLFFAFQTESFFTSRNILQLLRDSAYVGLIAIGLSFVMTGGGIDLSGGGIVCLVGILTARFTFISNSMPGIVVMIFGVLCGMALGAINSFFIVKVRLAEFVATLASGFIFSGLAMVFAFRDGGRLVSRSLDLSSYLNFGSHVSGLYFISIAWILATAIAYIIQRTTKYGLHTYAMGSNKNAAEMSGVDIDRMKASGFLISGGCAGLASVFVVASQHAANITLGRSMEFQAIAANVVGGVVLGGGKGDAISTLMGALFLTLLLNGIVKLGLGTHWQYIIQGLVIIFALTFDSLFSKVHHKRVLAT